MVHDFLWQVLPVWSDSSTSLNTMFPQSKKEIRAGVKIVSKQSVAFILKWAHEANNNLRLILLCLPFVASINFKVPDVSRFGFCQGKQFETKSDGFAWQKLSEELSSFKFNHRGVAGQSYCQQNVKSVKCFQTVPQAWFVQSQESRLFYFSPSKQRSTVFTRVPLQNTSQAMCGTRRLSAPSNEGPCPNAVVPAERIYQFRGQSNDINVR